MTPEQIREKLKPDVKHRLKGMFEAINAIEQHMKLIASLYIPEFHFLSHDIDTMLWECEKSPIEVCVFDITKGKHTGNECYYCGAPRERK